MCDTIVALGPATRDGVTLFGKNSDREPDETQNIETHPPGRDEGPERALTHVGIPSAGKRNGVFLCRPYWMFGAEMGANDKGVVIGNEALFTREKPEPTGLTGMDLLRLALERADTAGEARDTIIELLERHGQGGACGHRLKASYMNGFLIADAREAYVLETVRSWWAWKKVTDVWSISNVISLRDDFDQCSPGLIENAVKKGWARREDDFDFRRCYSDRLITAGAKGDARQRRSRERLAEKKGDLLLADVISILRDHGPDSRWRPWRQKGAALCMHAKDPLFGRSQSTGSLVACLGPKKRGFFATGSSTPCLSPFFPVAVEAPGIPADYRPGGEGLDSGGFWWEMESLHRRALPRFESARARAMEKIAPYERALLDDFNNRADGFSQNDIDAYFDQARTLKREWGNELEGLRPVRLPLLYRVYWAAYNRHRR